MPSRPIIVLAALSLTTGSAVVGTLEDPDGLRAGPTAAATPLPTVDDLLGTPRGEFTRQLVSRTAAADFAGTAGTAEDPAEERVVVRASAALDALARHVTRRSHPDALRLAFHAYFNYQASHPERVRKPYLYFVDYGLDSSTPRGYVFDMRSLTVVDGPFTVAHGRGSANGREGIPTSFSNTNKSAATSLGLYLAQETYAFSGRASGQRYRSIGLRLNGVSGRFNSAARARGVVAHGAPYVTPNGAGRSEGCPAMEEARAQRLLPRLANGGMVFLFSPQDPEWLRSDPWFRGTGLASAR
jgi:hypothetical protein